MLHLETVEPATLALLRDILGLPELSEKDIAALKINAITNRGTRKDFVDFAFLLRRHSLKEMFDWFRQKYQDTNPILAVRSLVYFVDAEEQPLPRMLVPFDWEAAKDEIRAAVRSLFGG